jgi:ankyrin repeat protein
MIAPEAAEADAAVAAVMPSRLAAERRRRVILAAVGCVVLAAAGAYQARARRDALLADAVARGDARSAAVLLAAGARTDARDPATGRSLAELAAMRTAVPAASTVEVVKELAAKGADPLPAAAEAALRGRADVVRELVRWRPALAAGDEGGRLLRAAAQGGDVATLRAVLAPRTAPLDWAAPEPANERGMTPLLYAARSGRPEPVYLLARVGADLKARSAADGRTALMIAALWNDPAACRFLVANGAALEEKDAQGRTALLLAASAGRLPTLDYLLKAKADPNRRDGQGKTALTLAIEGGNADDRVLNRLRRAGARP